MGTVGTIFWSIAIGVILMILIVILFGAGAALLQNVFGIDVDKYPFIGGIAFSIYLMTLVVFGAEEVSLYKNFYGYFSWFPSLQTALYQKGGILSVHLFLGGMISISSFVMSFVGLFKRRKLEKVRKRDEAIAEKQKHEEDRINAEKQKEQEEWQKQLDREIERERRLAEVRHESTIMAMQAQIKLYAEYKEKGLDIERQVFDMRKTLIELEGHENKAMLDDVRKALDDL